MSFVPFDRGWRTRTVQYGANINENYYSLQVIGKFLLIWSFDVTGGVEVMWWGDDKAAIRPEGGFVTRNRQHLSAVYSSDGMQQVVHEMLVSMYHPHVKPPQNDEK